jgi:hypothetical protein
MKLFTDSLHINLERYTISGLFGSVFLEKTVLRRFNENHSSVQAGIFKAKLNQNKI